MALTTEAKKGDPLDITADDYNSFIQAATFVKQAGGGGAGSDPTIFPNVTTIRVMNNTGAALSRFAAVGISDAVTVPTTTDSDPATKEFLNRSVLKVRTPTAADVGKFLILLKPLQDQKIGIAVAIGVCVCSINLVATTDTTVDVVSGNTVPQSSVGGSARILYVKGGVGSASATGVQFALISVGVPQPPTGLIKITGNATMGGVYTSRIWKPPASIDVTGSTFSSSTLGTDPGSDNCYALNLPEIGGTTHDLTDASNASQFFFNGRYWAPALDGKSIYLIVGFWNEDCT